jgi:diguanylate cyclase (GGDEF)-like protein
LQPFAPESGSAAERKRRIIGAGFAVARRNGSAILSLVIPALGLGEMAKRKVLLVDDAVARLVKPASRQGKPVSREGKAEARRMAPEERAAPAPKKPTRAAAMALAAEVDRLKAELAAARDRMEELEARADIDALLDILNRRGFERELRRSAAYVKRYGTPAALIYLDLDYFKPINDRYGHTAGDQMLRAVAATLQRSVRESDVVARLGGDEFGVLLWNISEIQVAAKMRELESAVATTVVMQGSVPVSVGVSAGFAMLGSGDAPADVIYRADLAMYVRKRAGRAAAG